MITLLHTILFIITGVLFVVLIVKLAHASARLSNLERYTGNLYAADLSKRIQNLEDSEWLRTHGWTRQLSFDCFEYWKDPSTGKEMNREKAVALLKARLAGDAPPLLTPTGPSKFGAPL